MGKKLSPQRRKGRRGKKGGRARGKKPDKGRPGPETLCTEKVCRSLATEIKKGSSIKAACGARGIEPKSLRDWRAKAEQGVEPYASIFPPLKKALASAMSRAEQRVYAGRKGWQSSARWLESMKPKPWRRTEQVKHGGGGEPIPVNVNLASELLGKVLEAALKPGVPGVGGKKG